MFFVATKIFWFLACPSHLIFWCTCFVCLGLIFRIPSLAVISESLELLLFIFAGVTPPDWYVGLMEGNCGSSALPAHADGILTLGGGVDHRVRLVATYELARKFPNAAVVFSGGSGGMLRAATDADAQEAERTLLALGLDKSRLTLENRSRNTWENLLFARRLIQPKLGSTWILATSASQLPRAMAVAQQVGWPLIPWQTDHDPEVGGWFDITANLMAFDEATRELAGAIGYRLTGRASVALACDVVPNPTSSL